MDEFGRLLEGSWADAFDLLEDQLFAALLVPDRVEAVDHDKNVGLFCRRRPDELLGRLGEVVRGGDYEDDHVNLLLPGEDGGCLGRVKVEPGRVDESNVDDAIVEQRLVHGPHVLDVDFALRVSRVVGDNLLQLCEPEHVVRCLVVPVVDGVLVNGMDLLDAAVFPGVEHLAEYAGAWLLVLGQDLPSKQRVAESRFSGVQVSRHQHLARLVLDAFAEVEQVLDRRVYLSVQQRRDRRLLERVNQFGLVQGPQLQIQLENGEFLRNLRRDESWFRGRLLLRGAARLGLDVVQRGEGPT